MTRYVAFLRGINLGNRRVKMAKLRGHLVDLGLREVDTFLASGNVIFDADDAGAGELEARIEAHLEEALGFSTETFVRRPAALERLTTHDVVAAGEEEGFKPYVVFLREEPGDGAAGRLAALETPDDRLHLVGREVVWLRRGGISDTPVSPADFEAAVGGVGHTRRTLNTVRRILAKYGS